MTDESAALRAQIEEVIAWAGERRSVEAQNGSLVAIAVSSAFAAVEARLLAILPSPPLVIEPGRWYRLREGRKVMVLYAGASIQGAYAAGAEWRVGHWSASGQWDSRIPGPHPLDIIAPWEDADA